jgi:hypothetical protein
MHHPEPPVRDPSPRIPAFVVGWLVFRDIRTAWDEPPVWYSFNADTEPAPQPTPAPKTVPTPQPEPAPPATPLVRFVRVIRPPFGANPNNDSVNLAILASFADDRKNVPHDGDVVAAGRGYSTSPWRILNDGNLVTPVETSSDVNPVPGVAYCPPVLCNKIRRVNRRGCPPCAQRLVGCERKVYALNGEEVFKHRFSSASDAAEYVFAP